MKVPYTKCGRCGNTVWQRNRYGQISYPYHVPANLNTQAQRCVRAHFGEVSARWRTLSEVQRRSWQTASQDKRTRRRLGKRYPLPGFNYFVQVNVAQLNRGLAQVDWPPAVGGEPRPAAPLLSQLLVQYFQGRLSELPAELRQFLGPPPPGSG